MTSLQAVWQCERGIAPAGKAYGCVPPESSDDPGLSSRCSIQKTEQRVAGRLDQSGLAQVVRRGTHQFAELFQGAVEEHVNGRLAAAKTTSHLRHG